MRNTAANIFGPLLAIAILCSTTVQGQNKGAAPSPPPKPKALFKELIPNPTGQNGMEDYLRAADRVKASQFAQLL